MVEAISRGQLGLAVTGSPKPRRPARLARLSLRGRHCPLQDGGKGGLQFIVKSRNTRGDCIASSVSCVRAGLICLSPALMMICGTNSEYGLSLKHGLDAIGLGADAVDEADIPACAVALVS